MLNGITHFFFCDHMDTYVLIIKEKCSWLNYAEKTVASLNTNYMQEVIFWHQNYMYGF